MAAFDFPSSPNNGDTYSANGIDWIYNGSVWKKDATAGVKGQKGEVGQKGQKGEVGEKGTKGEVGDKGQKGEIGATGGSGGTGSKGQKGESGVDATGTKGQKGEIGSTGGTGGTGDKGQKGATGSGGSSGSDGDKGQKGEPAAGTNGKILQVVSTTVNSKSSYSVGNGAYSTVSGLSAAITPSSSSNKILITVNIGGMSIDYSRAVGASLAVNGSRISAAKGAFASAVGYPFQTYYEQSVSFSYLHSPGTTSTQTYTVQLNHSHNGTRTIYFNTADNEERVCASTITAMEVD